MRANENLQVIYPEAYGAKALSDPRTGDLELAQRNSRAFAAMLADISGPRSYGGTTKFCVPIFLTGWYPICEEIRVCQFGVQITGKGPGYDGSGLRWFGKKLADQSMIHLSESDSSRLTSFGLIADRSDEDRLLAPIRTSWTTGSPQRDIRIESVWINDPVGYFMLPCQYHSFDGGIVSGGPGSKNGNDDFFVIDHYAATGCRTAIRVDHGQAVQWSISNFKSTCDHMYEARQGGAFVGTNWYPGHHCKSVIRCTGSRNDNLHIDLRGFSSEYLTSEALVDVSSSVSGRISGHMLQTSGTNEPRDFYWLRMRDYAACRLVFQDLLLNKSNAYGSAPVRHCLQFGPDAYSNVEYRVAFDSCHGIDDIHILQNAGPIPRKVNLRVDERRVMLGEFEVKNPTIAEILK